MSFVPSGSSSSQVADHLSVLSAKVDEIAQRAGVSAVARLDLETTLATLPWPDQRRLGLILESARVSMTDKAVRKAVEVMLARAAEVWARVPPANERSGDGPQDQ